MDTRACVVWAGFVAGMPQGRFLVRRGWKAQHRDGRLYIELWLMVAIVTTFSFVIQRFVIQKEGPGGYIARNTIFFLRNHKHAGSHKLELYILMILLRK